MYCPVCGLNNDHDARFCYKCGTRFSEATFDAPVETPVLEMASESSVTYGEPTESRSQYEEFSKKVASNVAGSLEKAEYAAEVARLRRSLMACRIGGVICAIAFASFFGPYGATPMLIIAGFFTPYGFAPIRRWVEAHGYFLILNWLLLAVLFVLVMVVAAILGPIYAVYAHLKIARCKELAA